MNLSPTKLSAMSKCPFSFKAQNIYNLQPIKESANLAFGKAIHAGVEAGILQTGDPVEVFKEKWGVCESLELKYSSKDDWTSLNEKGLLMMEDFRTNYLQRFRNCYTIEGEMSFDLDQQSRLYGRTDYVGEFITEDGEVVKAIVDIKTSSSKYSENDIKFNDQLTAYSIGSRMYPFQIEKIILFVFVKTKTPYIQVIEADKRKQVETEDYMDTAKFHLENIYRGRFPKIKGDHCGWCDYCNLCAGDMLAVAQELKVSIKKYNKSNGEHEALHEFEIGKYNRLYLDYADRPMLALSKFIKEYDISPDVPLGFEVFRGNKYMHDARPFFYWWENGKLRRVRKSDVPFDESVAEVELTQEVA